MKNINGGNPIRAMLIALALGALVATGYPAEHSSSPASDDQRVPAVILNQTQRRSVRFDWDAPVGNVEPGTSRRPNDGKDLESKGSKILALASDSGRLRNHGNAYQSKEPATCVPNPPDPSAMDCYTNLVADLQTPGAIGTRTPLIVIHGIHSSSDGFDNLINHLVSRSTYNNFTSSYKVYRFYYDSDRRSVWEIAKSLRNWIDYFAHNDPSFDKQIVIIAHSMGGLVARSYINEHDTNYGQYVRRRDGERVKTLITLGTPHHGSPMANGSIRVRRPMTTEESLIFPEWENVLGVGDRAAWHSCAACQTNPRSSNRGELRWDNLYEIWSRNSYENNQTEFNDWLRNLSHTYDNRIIAYGGTITADTYLRSLGHAGAYLFATLLGAQSGYDSLYEDHTKLKPLSVIVERVRYQDFLTPILGVNNDGVVPIESSLFFRPQGSNWPQLKRPSVKCEGYDHEDLRAGRDTPCNNGLILFKSIENDLELNNTQPPPNGNLLVNPNSSWDYGSVAIGSSSSQIFILSNTGSSALSVTGLSISGPASNQFSLLNPPSTPFTIAAGGSQPVTVRFAPTLAGSKGASFTIYSTSANIPVKTISLSGSGAYSGCSYSLSASLQSFSVAGGSGSFTVVADSGCNWNVSSDSSWVTVTSGSGGTGTRVVTYNAAANIGSLLRVGTITVGGGSTTLTFTVTEDGTSSTCNYSLSSNYQSFSGSGGSGSFVVATPGSCGWSASSNAPWIMLDAGSTGLKLGTQSISFSVTSNPSNNLRFGSVTIQGQGTSLVFTVSEDGSVTNCAYSLSSTDLSFGQSGGQGSFTINAGAGCRWQLSTSDSWITSLSTNNGFGPQSITFSVLENQSTNTRYGSIVIQGANATLMVGITQTGLPIQYPNINLPTTSFQMGDALLNTTIYQGVVISNIGQGYLLLGSVYRSSGSADFDVVPYGQNQSIAPGGSTSVTIKLTPASTGNRSATFTITSNDPNNPAVSFSISGNGVTQITGGIDFVWNNKSTIPESQFTYGSSAVINNFIYVFALGNSGTGKNYKYDPTTNSWTPIADAPFSTYYGGADVIGGKIYLVAPDFIGSTSGKVQKYDPIANSWTVGANPPNPREGMAVAAANGKLYAIGGSDGSPTNLTREYDPSTNTWTTKTAMPTARSYSSVAVVNNLVYVIGGYDSSIHRLPTVEVFNPGTNTWSTRENMPTQRSSASAVVLNNKIEVIGGSQGGPDTINVVEEHDPSLPGPFGTWFTKNHILTARADFVAGVVNGKVYVIGGRANTTGYVTTVEEGVLAASPRINVPVTSFNCGDVPLGNFCDKVIEVQNEGNGQLVISNWGRSSGSTDFTSFFGTSVVEAGESTSLVVRFTPSSTGSKTATFFLNSNDPSTPTLNFNLSANAVTPPSTSGTWQVVNTIQLPNPSMQSTRIAIANGKAYVSRYPATVSIVDLASGTTTNSIQFSSYPNSDAESIALADNRAYVVLSNLSPGQVAVVNTDNNSVLTYVPVSGVHAISIAATDTHVYLPNSGPNTVSVIDRGTNTVTNTIPVSAGASWIAIDPNRGRAYVTGGSGCGTNSPCVSVIDTTTNAVVSTIPMPTPYSQAGIAVSNNRAYFLTEASVEVIDLSSNSPIASIPVPRYADGGSIAATGEYVFVGSGFSVGSTVSVISTSTNFIVGQVTVNSPNSIAVDPATGLVYVVDYSDSTISVLKFVAPNFSVSTNVQSVAAPEGESTTMTCTVTPIDGFFGTVDLTVEGLPTGAGNRFTKSNLQVSPKAPATTTLTITIPSGTVSGAYGFKVVGTSGNLVDFVNMSVTVPTCFSPVSSSGQFFPVSGGSGSVSVSALTNCPWTATTSDSWIVIVSSDNGTGNAVVDFELRENFTGSARSASLNVAGYAFTLVQDGGLGEDCQYLISPAFTSFSAGGGTGTIQVFAAERCAWQATTSDSFITITSGGIGIGNGTVTYTVGANPGASGRKGTITIAGQTFAVKQKGN